MKIKLGQRTVMLGTAMTIVIAGIALALVGAGGIVAWEYSNSNAFCTNNCHAVHPEEPRAYAAYSHARVQCVECHMGRLPTLQLMTLKAAHYHELLGMFTGYKRPLNATTLRPARDSCEGCHWPAVNHDDKVRTKVHYEADAKNTEVRTQAGRAHRRRRGARQGDPRHPLARRAERRVRHATTSRSGPFRGCGSPARTASRRRTSTRRARSAARKWTRRRSAGWTAPTATTPPGTRSRTPRTASTRPCPKG